MICVVASLLFACEEQTTAPPTNTKQPVVIGFTSANHASSRAESSEPIDAAILSIKDSKGNTVHDMERMDLITLGGGYITKEVELLPGTYTIENFVVVNQEDEAVYITPKDGARYAGLVSTPLPYTFEVTAEETNDVVLDVVSATLGEASDFGYATFSFNVIPALEAGLVAYFPFNNDAHDQSGYENHGMVNGPVGVSDRFGTANSAFYFDGKDDYIEVTDHSSLQFSNEFSLCAWINLETGKVWGSRIIDKAVGSEGTGFVLDTYHADQTGRAIRFHAVNPWQYKTDNLLSLNQWHHVVATFKDGEGNIYLDGELEAQSQGDQKALVNDNVPLRIGFDSGVRTGNDFDDGFQGTIDEVRIYNRQLSAQEVNALFQSK